MELKQHRFNVNSKLVCIIFQENLVQIFLYCLIFNFFIVTFCYIYCFELMAGGKMSTYTYALYMYKFFTLFPPL